MPFILSCLISHIVWMHTKNRGAWGLKHECLPLLSASHSSSRMPFFPINLEELNTHGIPAPLTNLGKAVHRLPVRGWCTFHLLSAGKCHFCGEGTTQPFSWLCTPAGSQILRESLSASRGTAFHGLSQLDQVPEMLVGFLGAQQSTPHVLAASAQESFFFYPEITSIQLPTLLLPW